MGCSRWPPAMYMQPGCGTPESPQPAREQPQAGAKLVSREIKTSLRSGQLRDNPRIREDVPPTAKCRGRHSSFPVFISQCK